MKRIMLLGSGELGKEFVISAKRMGNYVIACDSYKNAPAMQVADKSEVFNMLDADALRYAIDFWNPDIIVPEIEAIATHVLYECESNGIQVVPSARAVNLTMNRDAIRDRAKELGIRVANFEYASSEVSLIEAVNNLQCNKVVVKPVMSSSGKGQSVLDLQDTQDREALIQTAWKYACDNMRGNRRKVIVEEFIDFDYEITLLTIVKKNNRMTMFCDPIGHVQKNGDYQYSWQPQPMSRKALNSARTMAETIVKDLTPDVSNAGIFGVEFFVKGDDVIFSELSPRPHDTGMVTLRSQRLSEFDLHLRAILDYPIYPDDVMCTKGASAVILSQNENSNEPEFTGIDLALHYPKVDVRIFGKPVAKMNRRMGVVLADDKDIAIKAASQIVVK